MSLFIMMMAMGLGSRAAPAAMAACNADTLREIAPHGLVIEDISDVAPMEHLPKTSNGVAYVPAGSVEKGSPEFCFVTGSFVTNPKTHKLAHFAVALPARRAWNGKFLFQGCGYNCGEIEPPALAEVARGYPVWATDDGHVGKPGPAERLPAATDASWAISSPGHSDTDAVTDFMYRAVHALTGLGKALTKKFYAASGLERSYFVGCSDGGREAMVELSRYPADYDGIVAGAPYFDMSNEMITTLVGIQAQLRSPAAAVPLPLYRLLDTIVASKCDDADGVKDGLIQDPARCAFDPEKDLPRCGAGSDPKGCFSQEQIDSLSAIFSAIRSPGGKVIYPGFSLSDPAFNIAFWLGFPQPAGELVGPDPWNADPGEQPLGWYWASGALKYLVYDGAPGFNPLKTPGITFKREAGGLHAVIPQSTVSWITRKTYSGTGARPSDAAAYLREGRKLIMYHGYSDGLITPYRTIQYYRALARRHGGYAQLQKNAELFMVPGMGHCWGGPGPNEFGQDPRLENSPTDGEHDVLTALDQWVEEGQRPTDLIATKYQDDDETKKIQRTMPLCPYPAMAKYSGRGDVDNARNWYCPAGDTRLEMTGPAGVRAGVIAPLR